VQACNVSRCADPLQVRVLQLICWVNIESTFPICSSHKTSAHKQTSTDFFGMSPVIIRSKLLPTLTHLQTCCLLPARLWNTTIWSNWWSRVIFYVIHLTASLNKSLIHQ
jgi:hypothetical protein